MTVCHPSTGGAELVWGPPGRLCERAKLRPNKRTTLPRPSARPRERPKPGFPKAVRRRGSCPDRVELAQRSQRTTQTHQDVTPSPTEELAVRCLHVRAGPQRGPHPAPGAHPPRCRPLGQRPARRVRRPGRARRHARAAPRVQSRGGGLSGAFGILVSHHNAAVIHGLPLLDVVPPRPALTIAPARSQRSGSDAATIIHAAALPASHVETRGAWSVTTAARTIGDLARSGTLLSALVAADSALNRGLATRQLLDAVAVDCDAWPGARNVRDVIRLCDEGSESPHETIARWHLERSGLPPVAQAWPPTTTGRSDREISGSPGSGHSSRSTVTSSTTGRQ